MNVDLYGIQNCDTVKKARVWLTDHEVAYVFHDFKKTAPDTTLLERWLQSVSADELLNRRGTTWRSLTDEERAQAATTGGILALLTTRPSLIKRPVLIIDTQLTLGFSPETYALRFHV